MLSRVLSAIENHIHRWTVKNVGILIVDTNRLSAWTSGGPDLPLYRAPGRVQGGGGACAFPTHLVV